MTAAEFNIRYPVGTPVNYHPTIGEREARLTITRGPAFTYSNLDACVELEGVRGAVSLQAISISKLTPAQARLVLLDLRKKEIEEYYDSVDKTLAAVVEEVGLNGYFEDDRGTVYKIQKGTGKFVRYKDLEFLRTKREGEDRGSLSIKEADQARANGFKPSA